MVFYVKGTRVGVKSEFKTGGETICFLEKKIDMEWNIVSNETTYIIYIVITGVNQISL